MASKSARRSTQTHAKPIARKSGKAAKAAAAATNVPAVARRGRLTLQQIRHAVDVALRGQTFEADA